MEFQGLDFDGDTTVECREIRKEMAKIYEDGTFGVAERAAPRKPFGEMSNEEKGNFNMQRKAETEGIRKRHQRILEKLKEIRQIFSKGIMVGS